MTDICRNLGHARTTYYRRVTPKAIDASSVKLRAAVRHIHANVHATYGSRRLQVELNAQGFAVGRYKVRSLMQALQLKAKRSKQHRYPIAGKPSQIAPNSLNGQFNPTDTNTYWTGDITYIRTNQGWLYLAIVLDLYSRRIVSWAFSNQPNGELSVRAINLAVQLRQPKQPVLFHTDQGVQYSSDVFRRALAKHNINASMSRRGNCLDNAVTERFFRSLKSERVNYRQYKTRTEGMADIADYIEAFYNQKRRHSMLGNISPVEYEARQHKVSNVSN